MDYLEVLCFTDALSTQLSFSCLLYPVENNDSLGCLIWSLAYQGHLFFLSEEINQKFQGIIPHWPNLKNNLKFLIQ